MTMKITGERVLVVLAILGAVGGGLLAFGFRMETPAEVQEQHVEEFHEHLNDFQTHVENFDTFIIRDIMKDASREQRTLMVEAQTKLTCLTTGADTLVMLGLQDVCTDLGIDR